MFVPFKADHIHQIAAQEAQQHLASLIAACDLATLETKWSYTYMHDGKPYACAGVVEQWPGRGELWAYLDQSAGPHLLAMTREAATLMRESEFNRLEAVVRTSFTAGHRWVQLLGFELEAARMRRYFPDGEDAAMYAWVR